MNKNLNGAATTRPQRLPYVSRPQLRALQRVARGERLAIATHRNATFTSLNRKACLAVGRTCWELTTTARAVLAAASVPKLKVTDVERRPRVVSAR